MKSTSVVVAVVCAAGLCPYASTVAEAVVIGRQWADQEWVVYGAKVPPLTFYGERHHAMASTSVDVTPDVAVQVADAMVAAARARWAEHVREATRC